MAGAKNRKKKTAAARAEEPVVQSTRPPENANKSEDTSNAAQEAAKPVRASPSSRPVHQARESLISSDSGFNDFSGLLTLITILLVLSNLRMGLQNYSEFGVRFTPTIILPYIFTTALDWPCLYLVLFFNLCVCAVLITEKAVAKKTITTTAAMKLHYISIPAVILVPCVVMQIYPVIIFFACLTLAIGIAVFSKLISFVVVNGWCREDQAENKRSTEENLVTYPNNLTYGNMYYFLAAPTLCYELNYPRMPKRNVGRLLRKVFETLAGAYLLMALIQQWVIPNVEGARRALSSASAVEMLDKMLRLAVPNGITWGVFFYWFFHSWLNLLAEITLFGDRLFYRDWWNARSLAEFWALWNMPVHTWCLRHIYWPMRRGGVGKFNASVMVFIISALFHELLISVPLRMFALWSFLAMALQVPLAWVTSFESIQGRVGNVIMWLSLIMGLPLAYTLYWYNYWEKYAATV